MSLDNSTILEKIAHKTEGFSGAELKALVMEAGIKAISEEKATVSQNNFLEALQLIVENRKETRGNNHEGLYG